jgi:hypothetical protein
MAPGSALRCSQEPAVGTYPEPVESNSHPQNIFLHTHDNSSLPRKVAFPAFSFFDEYFVYTENPR